MDPWDELFQEHLKVSARDVEASERALSLFNARLKAQRNRLWYTFSAAAACFALIGGAFMYQQQTAPLPHTVAYEAYSQVNGAW